MTGLIFDIQRCSLQDGPGIRTTVFLKGCPLRCAWCHNPESQKANPEVMYDEGSCLNCLRCVQVCPAGCHKAVNGLHVFDRTDCTHCGICSEACLFNAIELKGYRASVAEVMDEVLKDSEYYRQTGGGLTVSGGEPLLQSGFTLALLKAAKAEGLHTCIETSGWAGWDELESFLPLTDIFLYDYKATGKNLHKELIGVDSGRIADNLNRLLAAGAAVVLRCPMIPGVNDPDEHLAAIADIAKNSSVIGVELMAYHNLGVVKETRLGREPSMPKMANTPDDIKERWLYKLSEYGCTNAKIG